MKSNLFPLLVLSTIAYMPLRGYGEWQIPDGVSLPMPSMQVISESERAQLKRQDGIGLMQAMNVPDGSPSVRFSGWSFPTSVVIGAISYQVVTGELNSFTIKEDAVSPTKLAEGFVRVEENEKEARIAAFGEVASSTSLTFDWVAPSFSFTPVMSGGGRLSLTNQTTNSEDVFVKKNLVVFMRAVSNGVTVATSLINAGLPEEERIPLPPTQ
jgi:hypothetical protein